MADTERKFTLLLVDDNATNLMLLAKIIEFDLPDVRVLKAQSARQGLEIAAEEVVDGAFIDVQMPQMSGLDMCRRLRAEPRTAKIPLVLMTAHLASPEMRAEGLEVGAYDFISQPISNVEMLARIKVMLRLCESERLADESNRQLQQQLEDHSTRLRWISGLLISGEGPLAEPDQQLLRKLASEFPDPQALDDQLFFEKLTTEFPLPWRRTVLKFALLDSIPVPLARRLSEIADIKAVFEYLQRHQLSMTETSGGEEYLYFKPQTRELLRKKAELNLDEDDRRKVLRTAADWYLQQENLSAALGCLIPGKDYAAVSQVLSQAGLTLLDGQYASRILPLIDRIPDDIAAQCGWLSLFRGMNRLREYSNECDIWLELAFQRFPDDNEIRGELLTLSQQVLQAVFLDGGFERGQQRIARFRTLAEELLPVLEPAEHLQVAFAAGLAEFFLAGDAEQAGKILDSALIQAQQLQLPEQQLGLNLLRCLLALQQGRSLVANNALEQSLNLAVKRKDPLLSPVQGLAACRLLHDAGDLAGFQQQRELLGRDYPRELLQHTLFAPLLDYYEAGLHIARGDSGKALDLLEMTLIDSRTARHGHIQGRLLQLRGLARAEAGQNAAAAEDLQKGLDLHREGGGSAYTQENLLFAGATCYILQRYEDAERYLAEGLEKSVEQKEERLRPGLHAWLAATLQRLGRKRQATEHIDGLIEGLQRYKALFFWGLVPKLLVDLLPLLTRRSDRQLLNPLLESRVSCAVDDTNRCIPLLRIRCLGHFQLQLEQERFDLSQVGQAPRQILTLLIAARNRTLSIELLMSQLWPDSSPGKARNNFDAAHSRLRKSLEEVFGKCVRQDYLVLEKGMLSLKYIWLDSAMFIEAMDRARYHLQRENYWQAEQMLWRMDRLWSGTFLCGYDLDDEPTMLRERLTQLRLEQLDMLARLLRRRDDREAAVPLLQEGLRLDPTQDSLIRQLLALYHEERDNRAAGLLLENYRTALQNEDYSSEEIEDLIEALGAQWFALHKNKPRRVKNHG